MASVFLIITLFYAELTSDYLCSPIMGPRSAVMGPRSPVMGPHSVVMVLARTIFAGLSLPFRPIMTAARGATVRCVLITVYGRESGRLVVDLCLFVRVCVCVCVVKLFVCLYV